MLTILTGLLLTLSAPLPQSTEFFTDGTNYVYREAQSCAWYVDLPSDVMLRLSYRRYSGDVFFAVVGGPWNAVATGTHHMTTVSTDVSGAVRHAFPSIGFIQPGADNRRGVASQQGEELIALLREAHMVELTLDGELKGRFGLNNMDVAMDKLITCSGAYFGTAPDP